MVQIWVPAARGKHWKKGMRAAEAMAAMVEQAGVEQAGNNKHDKGGMNVEQGAEPAGVESVETTGNGLHLEGSEALEQQ